MSACLATTTPALTCRRTALTIEQVVDDVVAVLDDADVEQAILYGTSYGTYIAAGVGVRYPQRVAGMILDSPTLSAQDIDDERAAIRRVLWDGIDSDTADLVPKVRQLVADGVLTPTAGQLVAAVYGFGGPALVDRQLNLLLRGRHGLWSSSGWSRPTADRAEGPVSKRAGSGGAHRLPGTQLRRVPDGKPLDPAAAYREFASDPGRVRGRTLRSGDRDAEVRLAHRRRFRWP